MTASDYDWFRQNHVKARCVMGNDYYDHQRAPGAAPTAASCRPGEIFGYYVITHQYYARYRLPVMHTETNIKDARPAPSWLWKEWANMHRLKQDGVPILGFTWFSLTDQIDWDTALREKNDRVNECGLFDLNRKIRPVGEAYRKLDLAVARYSSHGKHEPPLFNEQLGRRGVRGSVPDCVPIAKPWRRRGDHDHVRRRDNHRPILVVPSWPACLVAPMVSQPLAWQGVFRWDVTGSEHFARIHRKREGAKPC